MSDASPPLEDQAPAPRPYWTPPGVNFDVLPENLQAAIVALINPAYRQLVLEAAPGLEASTGVTIVYLLWREVLEQIASPSPLPGESDADDQKRLDTHLARYLRVTNAKDRVSTFLLKLHEFRRKVGVMPGELNSLRAYTAELRRQDEASRRQEDGKSEER